MTEADVQIVRDIAYRVAGEVTALHAPPDLYIEETETAVEGVLADYGYDQDSFND